MADLSVEMCGVQFKNPFICSGSPGTNPYGGPSNKRIRKFEKAAKAGWAGSIVRMAVPTSSFKDLKAYGHAMWLPREIPYIDVHAKPSQFFGVVNVCSVEEELVDTVVPEYMEECIKDALEEVKPYQPFRIGADIGCRGLVVNGEKVEATMARAAENAGAEFLTIDLSCPGPATGGVAMGLVPEVVKDVTTDVRKATKGPLLVKIAASTPIGLFDEVIKNAEAAGADGLILTDSINAIPGVDIETGRPIESYVDKNGKLRGVITGITGPALRPVAMRCVASAFEVAPKLDISACGGVTTWDHAVEFIMLGAKTVEACTACMVWGYKVVKPWIKGLNAFMDRKGYNSIEDFRGITSKKYWVGRDWTDPLIPQPIEMVVDEDKCTGCGVCVPACENSGVGAIKVVDFKARIDLDDCCQCNMCMLVCPYGAVSRNWTKKVE